VPRERARLSQNAVARRCARLERLVDAFGDRLEFMHGINLWAGFRAAAAEAGIGNLPE
jgi:hypothetical protein